MYKPPIVNKVIQSSCNYLLMYNLPHCFTTLLTIINVMKSLEIVRYSTDQFDVTLENSYSRVILHTRNSEYLLGAKPISHRKQYRNVEGF